MSDEKEFKKERSIEKMSRQAYPFKGKMPPTPQPTPIKEKVINGRKQCVEAHRCDWCKKYEGYQAGVILSCKCACHDSKTPTSHDSLCCELPNASRRDADKLINLEYEEDDENERD